MKLFTVICVFVCMILLRPVAAGPGQAQFHFYTEHLPPYSYLLNDDVVGINVELVQTLCQRLELSCTVTLLPWRRAFEQAQQQPHSGVFSTSRTEEREALFQWVGPIASDWGYLFRLKGRTEVNPTNLQEAKGFRLAVARGDVYESYFRRHGFEYGTSMIDFATKTEPVPLFLQGRIDLLVGSPRALRNWMLDHQVPADMAEPLFKLRNVGDNYLALNLQFPPDVVEQLQQTLDAMRQNGELAALVERYQLHD